MQVEVCQGSSWHLFNASHLHHIFGYSLTVRHQIDATSKANSGHPGAPMGMAPVAHVLFNKFMNFNPKNPDWANRDRFVLSYVLSFYSSGREMGCRPYPSKR